MVAETAQFVSFPLLNKAQIKQVQVFGNAITLKSAFEKGGLLWSSRMSKIQGSQILNSLK